MSEADGITLGVQNVSALTVNAGLTGAGDIVTASNIVVAGNLVLDNNNGNIALNNNVGGSNVTLDASGTIAQAALQQIASAGTLSVAFGFGPVTLSTSVASLTTNAGANALTINEASAITLLGQTAGSLTINAGLTATGDITASNAFSVTNLTLNAGNGGDINLNANVAGTNTVSLSAGDTITQTASTLAGGALTLAWVNGAVSLTTNVTSLTASAAGQALTINETSGITLGALNLSDLSVTAGGAIVANNAASFNTLNLTATAGGIALNGAMNATTIALSANGGNITQTATAALTATTSLSVNVIGGSANLTAANNTTALLNASGTGLVAYNNGNSNLVIGTLGAAQSLTTLTTGTTSTTGSLTTTGNIDITTRTLVFDDTMTANQIDVRSAAGGGLTIDSNAGAATYNATVATTFDAVTNDLTLTNGNITFNGLANLTADTSTQNVVVAANAVVNGNDQVNVNSCHVILSGILTGNPLVYNCPFGIGTIANNNGAGDVNLLGDIIFAGADFAILAKGNINTTGLTTINV
ncbi:MAG: hypothetical protein KIT69_18570, partial [Propionibacteriaceae bacterium]|nr:hypothetical protein [Propionibacteriaceae bacterium]